MKIFIDTVVSSPDAELPKPEIDHEYTIIKTTIEQPKIGLFELWRMKKFIEMSYTRLKEDKERKDKLAEETEDVVDEVLTEAEDNLKQYDKGNNKRDKTIKETT